MSRISLRSSGLLTPNSPPFVAVPGSAIGTFETSTDVRHTTAFGGDAGQGRLLLEVRGIRRRSVNNLIIPGCQGASGADLNPRVEAVLSSRRSQPRPSTCAVLLPTP